MGTAYLIRPDVAISHEYNMVALANFAVDPLAFGLRRPRNFQTFWIKFRVSSRRILANCLRIRG